MLHSLAVLTSMTQTSVAGGYVVALTLVVLLQYVHYLHRQQRVRLLADQFRREVDGLSTEVLVLNRERNLHRLEIQLLREVLGQTDCARAYAHLLKRFVPNPDDAFAVVLSIDSAGGLAPVNRGLSDASVRNLQIDAGLLRQLKDHGAVIWESPSVQNCPLYAQLTHLDRKKARHLFAIPLGDEQGILAVMIATTLLPIAAGRNEQIELTSRVMSSIAPNLRQTLQLERQSAQLRCTQEMLELRAITDTKLDQPMKMLERFLSRLGQMVDSDRTSLFLPPADPGAASRLVLAAGMELQPGVATRWTDHETKLVAAGGAVPRLITYDTTDLVRLRVDTLLGSAATIPLEESGHTLGLLCVTRRTAQPFSKAQRQLLAWAGEALSSTLDNVRSFSAVERQARIDGLTQLANRRTFDAQLQQEIEQLRRGELVECSLLLMDLDRFKSINDRFGHQAGDEVLREASRIIQEQVARTRITDRALLARYGGEELAILLPEVGINGALRIAETIRAAIEKHVVRFSGMEISMTISIGAATAPLHARSAEDLVANADAALYRAKSNGRNRVTCAADAAA
jgi:diguanylate cyclase (GGDEF)-like protein